MTKISWRVVVLGLIWLAIRLALYGGFRFSPAVVEPTPEPRGPVVEVVVSKVDIPPGTDLDQLIKNDQFRLIGVPQDAVVDGAVTSVEQLRGQTNILVIFAGDQIPTGERFLTDRLENAG